VRDPFLHWKSRFCTHWAGGGEGCGTERIPMRSARDATPLAEEVAGSKRPDIIGPGQLALGWWVRWGGRDGDWE
jgi:hypothetical protein